MPRACLLLLLGPGAGYQWSLEQITHLLKRGELERMLLVAWRIVGIGTTVFFLIIRVLFWDRRLAVCLFPPRQSIPLCAFLDKHEGFILGVLFQHTEEDISKADNGLEVSCVSTIPTTYSPNCLVLVLRDDLQRGIQDISIVVDLVLQDFSSFNVFCVRRCRHFIEK